MNKMVSICIPTYNNTFFLRRSLQAILNQTYTNYEVVITDDSDTDDVETLISEYDFAGKLHYFRNKKALGSPKNWNYCISKATGDYVKIIHHDDSLSENTSLEKLVLLLESDVDNSIAFCGCKNIATDGSDLFTHSITPKEVAIIEKCPEFLFFVNKIGAPSVTIFKKNNINFDENIKYLVDVDFYINILASNSKFSYTTETLINIGHSEKQVTHQFTNNAKLLIFEYSYTYQKLNKNKNNFQWYFTTFWNLISSFDIESHQELINFGWQGKIPRFILYIVKTNLFIKKRHLSRFQAIIKTLLYEYCRSFYNKRLYMV